ncbi:isoprenylcysteine carboxylmethyltransferase family protein [Promineifilum sp.]|uniref:methyltransferase family protein n=1 Tax=Promineifilum sp. TaxID=2664178 RepID=UPI0035B4AA51
MTELTETQPAAARLNRNGARLFLGVLLFTAAQAGVAFLAAGTLRWAAAWAYFGVYALCFTLGLAWVASVNPAVINERGRRSTNTEAFDRRFHRVMPLTIFGGLIVGGLDHRFGWSTMPAPLQLAGLALLVASLAIASWVLATNAYASRVVRLQEGHRVVTTGPYRFVRHPMYSGTLLAWVAAALSLGSWWLFVPAALGIALFVWRTRLEDATLQEKLPGYREYARQTRYRLVPGVW